MLAKSSRRPTASQPVLGSAPCPIAPPSPSAPRAPAAGWATPSRPAAATVVEPADGRRAGVDRPRRSRRARARCSTPTRASPGCSCRGRASSPTSRSCAAHADRTWTCGKGVYAEPVAEHALALALAGLRHLGAYAAARSVGAPGRASTCSALGWSSSAAGASPRASCACSARSAATSRSCAARRTRWTAPTRVVGEDELDDALARRRARGRSRWRSRPTTGASSTAGGSSCSTPTAWVVNVARGAHIVTDDLVAVLAEGRIGGAALDVTDPEPLPDGHPLWSEPRCLSRPHTANTMEMAIPLLSERVRENVRRRLAGEPLARPRRPRSGLLTATPPSVVRRHGLPHHHRRRTSPPTSAPSASRPASWWRPRWPHRGGRRQGQRLRRPRRRAGAGRRGRHRRAHRGRGGRRPARRHPDRREGPRGRRGLPHHPRLARSTPTAPWPTADSPLVERLKAAGLRRRRQDQHARARPQGRHRQPALRRHRATRGTSAAAPAVRRAARRPRSPPGMVPLCTGSDGGGSIRIPSSVCGLSGMKPSLGRVPMGGAKPPGWARPVDPGPDGPHASATSPSPSTSSSAPTPTDLRSLPMPDTSWSRSLGRAARRPARSAGRRRSATPHVDSEVAVGLRGGRARPRGPRHRDRRGRPGVRRGPGACRG